MKRNTDMATDRDATRAWVDENTLNFTRYTFKETTGRKFVVGEHHRIIADAIDQILAGNPEYQYVMFNIPPRYGKTELVVKSFIAKGLAVNPQSRFLHLSYSDDLVKDNSKTIMETINSDAYQRLFPEVQIVGRSAKKWYTSAGGGMYAVSTGGQVTGFGAGQVDAEVEDEEWDENEIDEFIPAKSGYKFAGAVIIDDPLKAEDAVSDTLRERVNNRFENTIRSRTNSRYTPIVIIMQRLHEHDMCGYLQELEGLIENGGKWKVICLPALSIDEEGNEKALWDHKHTVKELHELEEKTPYIYETQYQQNPTPLEGLMYTKFRTYATFPIGNYTIKNYTDTADTGADFLCSIDYREYDNGDCYLLDVLYTDKPMEFTEPETARMITRDQVSLANIESNNGGRGFARNVEKNAKKLGNSRTNILWFTQSEPKDVRIFSKSAEVQNTIYYPEGWERKWPLFAKAVKGFRKEGRNAHDDAPDALTGICEKKACQTRNKWQTT